MVIRPRRQPIAAARLGLFVAVALVAAACFERGGRGSPARDAGGSPPAVAPPTTGWLAPAGAVAVDPSAAIAIGLEAEPVSLDPFTAGDALAARVLADVYEGLLCPDPIGAPRPCLAARYHVSDDRTEWRFWLRPGARFHDGGLVTAADVIASFRAPGRGETARGPLAAVLDDLIGIDRPAPDQVALRFRRDRVGRERDLALVPIAPAARIAAGTLARSPIGTGPFRLTRWRPGEAIELERWDGYWGPAAAAARVRYRPTADRAEALRLVATGDLDVVVQLPIAEAIAFAAANPGVARFRYEQPAFLAAIYQTQRPALSSPAARRALTALLDRHGIADTILGGARALTGPWPAGDAFADPAVVPVPFDPALARRLLAGARPTLEVLIPQGSTTTARIADVWAADARGVVALEVRTIPYADLLARLRAREFDIALTSMSAGPDLDLWSRLASDAPPDQAWSGLRDPALDRLLVEFRSQIASEPRVASARAIHRRIDELQPMAFIAVDTRAGVARVGITGVVQPSAGVPRARFIGRRR